MKIVIVGATKGMGRAVARLLAGRGESLYLLGRDLDDLARSAADLEARGAAVPVGSGRLDLAEPSGIPTALAAADEGLDGFDTLVVTAAAFGLQEELEEDLERLHRLLDINFSNTVLLCEAARRRLLTRGGGTLCVFSSVAGKRGRKPIVLYGATKAGLSQYLEGLDHRYWNKGLRVVTVKPGFVETSMTEGIDPPPFAGDPEGVARDVVRAIDRGRPVVYTPGIWRWVMLLIRSLPRFVMRRVGF